MENIGKRIDGCGAAVAETTERVSDLIRHSPLLEHHKVVTGKIFITGGKGVIGHRVALRLLTSGHPSVRVGFRTPSDECAEVLSKKGAEIADFCWNDESTYASVLEGVKVVFCVTPYVENWAQSFPSFLRSCEKAGVEYLVKVSFYHSRRTNEPYHKVRLVHLHGKCDELLTRSTIPYTILSASHFMSNPLVMHHDEADKDTEKPVVLYGSADGKNINYVSPNDIAEVATRVIMYSKPHMGKEYTLTGLSAISDDDVASAISKHTKRQVFYEDLPINMFEDKERSGGGAQWKVRDLVGLERIKATGLEEDVSFVSHDIEKICKRKPETLNDYLEAKEYMTPMESWLIGK